MRGCKGRRAGVQCLSRRHNQSGNRARTRRAACSRRRRRRVSLRRNGIRHVALCALRLGDCRGRGPTYIAHRCSKPWHRQGFRRGGAAERGRTLGRQALVLRKGHGCGQGRIAQVGFDMLGTRHRQGRAAPCGVGQRRILVPVGEPLHLRHRPEGLAIVARGPRRWPRAMHRRRRAGRICGRSEFGEAKAARLLRLSMARELNELHPAISRQEARDGIDVEGQGQTLDIDGPPEDLVFVDDLGGALFHVSLDHRFVFAQCQDG
mmetsp:Transcript_33254/g.96966  ORF Transcript_33254/g.96966 Transcript_33254/m.96966 type:complete len:263 (+) Transcript_33254:124-912(+)